MKKIVVPNCIYRTVRLKCVPLAAVWERRQRGRVDSMTAKQLVAGIAVLALVAGSSQASPTYWRATAASEPHHQDDDQIDTDAVPAPTLADRRRTVDAPVSVAIPLPGAVSAAMMTLGTIGLLMVVCRRRRLV